MPQPLILWGLSDGRAGHLAQSRGLMQALADLTPCSSHEVTAPPPARAFIDLVLRRARFGAALPDPDLIIGAGHGTHLALLCARRARGGRTVVLMRPSLPLALFDFCLIPEHDSPPARANVIPTRGPLNSMQPVQQRDPGEGLILIGGPSRHYRWDEDALLAQVRALIAGGGHWRLGDSPRTPAATRRALAALAGDRAEYVAWDCCPPGWVQAQMARAPVIWISRDSMSMIYESLTAGAAVGLLDVPASRPTRLIRAVDDLIQQGLVTPFRAWREGATPARTATPLNEARRCAALLLDRIRSAP